MNNNVYENQEEEKVETSEAETEVVNEEVSQQNTELENQKALANEYLNLARVIQADFDNYRKRSLLDIERARIDGITSTVEILLPSLDAFKKAKENIKDENTLQGINMLEKAFESSLEKLGVKKIEAVGKVLDPNLHNALAISKDESKEDGVILEEFQAGYIMNDKIIRYSQVLVNKI